LVRRGSLHLWSCVGVYSISDVTKAYGNTQYVSISECIKEVIADYRSSWNKQFDTYVEVWCEKEALTRIFYPVTL